VGGRTVFVVVVFRGDHHGIFASKLWQWQESWRLRVWEVVCFRSIVLSRQNRRQSSE
jgi:hypothetical protein